MFVAEKQNVHLARYDLFKALTVLEPHSEVRIQKRVVVEVEDLLLICLKQRRKERELLFADNALGKPKDAVALYIAVQADEPDVPDIAHDRLVVPVIRAVLIQGQRQKFVEHPGAFLRIEIALQPLGVVSWTNEYASAEGEQELVCPLVLPARARIHDVARDDDDMVGVVLADEGEPFNDGRVFLFRAADVEVADMEDFYHGVSLTPP